MWSKDTNRPYRKRSKMKVGRTHKSTQYKDRSLESPKWFHH